jgi:hypothetical protein
VTRAELLALAREALAAQRIAAPLIGKLVTELVTALADLPVGPDHIIFDVALLELLGEISSHGAAAGRLRDLLGGPLVVIASLLSPRTRRQVASALQVGTDRARENCACQSCAADRAAAAAALEQSLVRAREAARRPTG